MNQFNLFSEPFRSHECQAVYTNTKYSNTLIVFEQNKLILQSLSVHTNAKDSATKKKTPASCAAAKVFSRYDVIETSYHLYSDRIDLHLCDDPGGKGRSCHPKLSEGGAFQVGNHVLSRPFAQKFIQIYKTFWGKQVCWKSHQICQISGKNINN